MQKVDHFLPKVAVFFLARKWAFKGPATVDRDEKTGNVIRVESEDVLSFTVQLSVTKTPGTFNMTLNNKNLRYMVNDEPDEDITRLNKCDSKYKNLWTSYSKGSKNYRGYNWRLRVWEDGEGITYTVSDDNKISKIKKGTLARIPVNNSEVKTYPIDSKFGKNSAFENFYGGTDGLQHGTCIFKPMQRVQIWAAKRFPSEVEKRSQEVMVPVFTGLVDKVTVSYTENYNTIQITGRDVTKWLQINQINVNPILVGDKVGQYTDSGVKLWDNIFSGMDAPDIIAKLILGGTLDQTEGQVTGKVLIPGMGQFVEEVLPLEEESDGNALARSYVKAAFVSRLVELNDVYGTLAENKLRMRIPPETEHWRPYRMVNANNMEGYMPEFKYPLDICYEVAKRVFFEFYADAYGDIWFCPPRFSNRWILCAPNPRVYVIKPEDMVSTSITEADTQVKSSISVTAMLPWLGSMAPATTLMPTYVRVTDSNLAGKYGFRHMATETTCVSQVEGEPFASSLNKQLTRAAVGLLQRNNAEVKTGHISIMGRPEIQVGYPVYLSLFNMIYYITSVSHTYQAGGSLTTTLDLNYGRKPWEVLDELIPFTDSRIAYLVDTNWYFSGVAAEVHNSYADCVLLKNAEDNWGSYIGINFVVKGKLMGEESYNFVLATMMTESGGDLLACNELNGDGSSDHGLMQINNKAHAEWMKEKDPGIKIVPGKKGKKFAMVAPRTPGPIYNASNNINKGVEILYSAVKRARSTLGVGATNESILDYAYGKHYNPGCDTSDIMAWYKTIKHNVCEEVLKGK